MEAHSLLASAGINIGLALIILSLFSVLKKHKCTSFVYYPRRLSLRQHPHLSLNHHMPFDKTLTISRFIPTVYWIRRSFRITDAELLENCGLDALILIRLFKFGVRYFVVCSLVGLLVLLPVNYTSYDGPYWSTYSMDALTISNINKGSDRLWVHYSCLWFISLYALYQLHKEYKDLLTKRILQLRHLRDQPNQFTVLVREIPFCDEHKAYGCCVDHYFSKYHSHAYRSYQILYDGKDLEDLLNQATAIAHRIEDLRHVSLTKKHVRSSTVSDAFRDDAKVEQLEQMLEEVYQRIRHMRYHKMVEERELPVAFVTFRTRWGAALAAQSQQHSNPLLWITEMAPEPRDVLWRNLSIPYKRLPLYKIGVFGAASLLTIFFAIPVTAVQGIAKFDKLKKWFPPAMAVQLIPGLRSIVTGYLPSVILSLFIYTVPFAMIAMARFAGYISRSRKDIKACSMVFYFLVGNVFLLSLLSGSLLDQIGKSFAHPKDIPSRLASAVTAQADFFMTYILTSGLSGFSLEILQPGLLIWDAIRSHTWGRGKKRRPYLYSLPYYRVVPFVSLFILIGMVYAVVAPLLLPFLIVYFLLGYVVFINQIEDVYETTYETCGQYWPYIHHYIIVAIVIMQVTMIGLFGLKSKPAASFSTIPLLVFTIVFNEYCKIRFLPTFMNYSIQDAMKSDELDEKNGMMDANYRKALDAYCPPCLRPVDYTDNDAHTTEPLISPK
ncbi:hypothetical protein LguiB_024049 [Lonicera macranthoides]